MTNPGNNQVLKKNNFRNQDYTKLERIQEEMNTTDNALEEIEGGKVDILDMKKKWTWYKGFERKWQILKPSRGDPTYSK